MEPQINVENQNLDSNLNQPTKNPYKILFFLFLGLFLVVSSVLITLLLTKNKLETQKEMVSIQSADSKITAIPTESTTNLDTTSNLKTYENKEIGFSFKYSTTLGEFTFTANEGDVGNSFSGKFSNNMSSDFTGFGGLSVDFSSGRGASFGDFSGYSNKNNQVHFFSVGDRITNNNNLIDPKAIKKIYKNKNGVEIVLLTGYTLGQEDEMTLLLPCGIGEGNIGALVNTNSKTYPGIVFKFPKTLEPELMIVLDSLEII